MQTYYAPDYTWAFMLAAGCALVSWIHVMFRVFQAGNRVSRVQDLVNKHAPKVFERFDTNAFRRTADGKLAEVGPIERMANTWRLRSFIDSDELDDIPSIRQAKKDCNEADKKQSVAIIICVCVWVGSFLLILAVAALDHLSR